MEKLLNLFQSIHPLSDELHAYLPKVIRSREIPRKSFFLKSGHVCRSIGYIENGLLRCYYERNDLEICSHFLREGEIIVSARSFFTQLPSSEYIQSLEDTLLYYIEYNDIQHLYKVFPEFNIITRVLTERYYIKNEQMLFALRMQRSHERYAFLMQKFPELIQRVPSKYLASFLGITDVTLSNVKKMIS